MQFCPAVGQWSVSSWPASWRSRSKGSCDNVPVDGDSVTPLKHALKGSIHSHLSTGRYQSIYQSVEAENPHMTSRVWCHNPNGPSMLISQDIFAICPSNTHVSHQTVTTVTRSVQARHRLRFPWQHSYDTWIEGDYYSVPSGRGYRTCHDSCRPQNVWWWTSFNNKTQNSFHINHRVENWLCNRLKPQSQATLEECWISP